MKYNDIEYRVKSYATLDGGFTQISNNVLKIVDNAYQFTVYFYLCKNWNRTYNYAFPSIRTIAKDCKMSSPTVQKAIKALEDKKLVVVLKFEEKLYNTFPNNIYRIYYPIIIEEEVVYNIPQLTKEQEEQLANIEKGLYKLKIEEDDEENNENK